MEMFLPPRFIQSNFSIFFPRFERIRRKVNDFEDALGERYSQPQVLPVPDELDPEVPRILFDSMHGNSQIVISQISMSLNVSYTSDWQDDISKGRSYLQDRVPILFDLIGTLEKGQSVHYCGMVTRARLFSHADDIAIISHILKSLRMDQNETGLYGLEVKKVRTLSETFFCNESVGIFRTRQIPENSAFRPPRMSDNQIIEKGVEISVDYNDRYKYNEEPDYFTNVHIANDVIVNGISESIRVIDSLSGSKEQTKVK